MCNAMQFDTLVGHALKCILVRSPLHMQVDMLVGDIYGGRDYSSIGLSATTIASSFGKVVGQDKELGDYNPAGEVCRLCCMTV
jgi:pantothenate kinase